MSPGIPPDGAAEDADPRLSGEMTAVSLNWFTEILDLVPVGIHEGELVIESEEKKGTKVMIRMPASRVMESPSKGGESLAPDGENKGAS